MKKTLWLLAFFPLLSCKKVNAPGRGDLSFPPVWDNTAPVQIVNVETYSFYLGINPFRNRFFDLDTTRTDVQDRILVEFSRPVNAATLPTAISLEGAAGVQTGSIPVEVEYDPETWRAWIIPQVGLRESTAYILRITPDARDLAGNPLDGNGNGVYDDTLDTVIELFWGPPASGGDPDFDLDLRGPRVQDLWTDFRNPWFYPGNLLTSDTLRIEFDRVDLDPATLSGNVFFRTYPEGTAAGNLIYIRVDTVGTRVQAVLYYDGLAFARAYELVLAPGIRDTAGNPLDGNGNGERELRDSLIVRFTTAADTQGTPPSFPHLTGSFRNGNVITLFFDVPMDTSTFAGPDFQVRAMVNGVWTGESARLRWAPDGQQVDVLLSRSEATFHEVFLSHRLLSRDGLPLDGNGDGLGGDPASDDITRQF